MQIDIDDLLITGAPIHTINEHLAGGHTLAYRALTCKYQHDSLQAESIRSICAATALNCVRLAFQLEAREGNGEAILRSFVSEEMINQVMDIANNLFFDIHLEIDELLEVPIFKETVISKAREQGHRSLETLKDLVVRLFPPESLKPVIAVVFTQTPEHIVCFRFRSSASHIFVIFDAHSRSEHPFGPAFILASDIDAIVTHFSQLLTKPSISKPFPFTALVIESRENSSTIDVEDRTESMGYHLSEKLGFADQMPPTLNLGAPVSGHLEQLRVRAETLRTQNLADVTHNNNQQIGPSSPASRKDTVSSTRRTEFGWQLNLHASGTPSTVDPKNNRDSNLAQSSSSLEVKKPFSTVDPLKKNECGWFTSLIPVPRSDGEDIDISLSNTSKAGKENIRDAKLLHMHNRAEFSWQMALQQPSKTEDLDIMTSAVFPQADTRAHSGVLFGKERAEISEEVFATQTLSKGSDSGWQDVLMKQLQDEEELVTGYFPQENTCILAWRKQVEEDLVRDAVASSSSSHAVLGQKELDFKPLPSTEDESWHHSRHSPIFYLDALHSSNRGFARLELPTSEFPIEPHECGVCNELYNVAQIIQLPTCAHTFCRECLRTFTKTKISEGRYPISCPVCAIERTRVSPSHITQAIIEKLEFSEQDLEKLYALQLVAHSVTLHCPKCKQTMNVDRGEYTSQRTIICPLPACRHKWCKECLKSLASSQTEHNCKQHGFERLMRRKGWKYCPGCNTPVQKETGCNHMTCGSPGCNVHFCYKCGMSIIDTTDGGDVGSAVTEHYINCVMFEKRRRCIIQ